MDEEGSFEPLARPTDEFVRLSADYDRTAKMTLGQYITYLEGFPRLHPNEMIFAVATQILTLASKTVGLKMLEGIAGSNALVAGYARAFLVNPPE